jgi:DNA gyrase/topoisomerase IV subunit A
MPIKTESLSDFGIRNISGYATEVNLDRAIPELYDGLKPVLRRVAWSMNSFKGGEAVKSAKVVGHCIGSYHPHGDAAAYGAMQTMVHHNVPLLEGVGNWGGLLDPAAAQRYTNVKLSKMGASVFESDYLAVTDMVPNYDDTAKEPVVLPVRLPMLVLNGADGIGVGITCSIPTFTVESVVEVLKQLFSGVKLEPKDYARILKPKQHWGGHLVKSAANKKAWLELMETGKAKVQFESTLVVDEAKKSITISEWPNGLSVDKFVQKVRLFPECQRCYNSKGSTTFTIECKKAYNLTQFNTFVEKVQKLTRVATAYKLNVTHRVSETKDGVTRYKTEFLALSVAEFFLRWCRLRLQLEKRCLEYRMARQQGLIDYSKLLIFACSKLPVIFKSLKVKDSAQYLVDNLGITLTQANQILDLKVRALSKLDQDALKTKLREQERVLKVLQKTYRKPKPALIAELPTLLDLIKVDKQVKNKRFNQQLTVH